MFLIDLSCTGLTVLRPRCSIVVPLEVSLDAYALVHLVVRKCFCADSANEDLLLVQL